MNEELVELIEVFVPTDEPTGIIRSDGQAYKSIALLCNGKIIRLEKEYGIQKHWITEKELEQLEEQNHKKEIK